MHISTPPDALLLIAPGCPHCATVLAGFAELVKGTAIGRLEIVNIASHPERAQVFGVRSVPWFRIGEFELEGLHGPADLLHWTELAGNPNGMREYFRELLSSGARLKVEALIRRAPEHLDALAGLLGDETTGLDTRLGIMATIEELAGETLTDSFVGQLGQLIRHENARVRADACEALVHTAHPHARPYLEIGRDDPDTEVREIAREGLERLPATTS